MEFDTSDVVVFPAVIKPVEDVIELEEDDMLEAACVVPQRQAAGTVPPTLRSLSERQSSQTIDDPRGSAAVATTHLVDRAVTS